jgi:hypothetical protein
MNQPAKIVFSRLRKQADGGKPARIKMAHHLLNMLRIDRELSAYSLSGLQKAASSNTTRSLRVKYASLLTQRLIEKQAFLAAFVKRSRSAGSRGRRSA